jgi:soluble cytochrome b562
MYTIYDFGMAITEIRDIADSIEVKGAKNAALVSMIFQKCNAIISDLNKIVEEKNKENGEEQEQVGDADGQIDS